MSQARPISVCLTNELGNRIRITVESRLAVGIIGASGKTMPFGGVAVTLIGPTSTTENIITLDEARQLHAALGEYLSALSR